MKYIDRWRLMQLSFWFFALLLAYIVFDTWQANLLSDEFSFLRGRQSNHRHPIIGIVMMIHNDDDILPYWLRYHSALIGAENIVVLDQRSTSEKTLRTLFTWSQRRGLKVLWNQGPYSAKGNLTFHAFQEYLDDIDIAIPLDSDEFLTAFEGSKPIFSKSFVLKQLQDFWDMKISCWGLQQYYSSLQFSFNDTVSSVHHFHPAIYTLESSKKIMRYQELTALDHGSHTPTLANGNCVTALNRLGLLHYHFRNPMITVERALNDVIGFGYLPINTTLSTLKQHRSKIAEIAVNPVPGNHKIVQLLTFLDKGVSGLLHDTNAIDAGAFDLGTIEKIVQQIERKEEK